MRQLTLLSEIDRLVKAGSQLIIATHSPILMAYPGACIYELSEQGIAEVAYKDTEHYRMTKQFLENPERMMKYLLEQ
jgi:predicted ATPase